MNQIEVLEPRRLLAFGDLVTSFGQNGIVTETQEQEQSRGLLQSKECLVVLTDGRTLEAGKVLVMRRADGSLDPTFNGTGEVDLPGNEYALAAHQAPDGSLVVMTNEQFDDGGEHEQGFRRYDLQGNLDQSFGSGGFSQVIREFTEQSSESDLYAFALDSTGEAIFVGTATVFPTSMIDPGYSSTFVEKLNADGARDMSFGGSAAFNGTLNLADADVQQILIDPFDHVRLIGADADDSNQFVDVRTMSTAGAIDTGAFVTVALGAVDDNTSGLGTSAAMRGSDGDLLIAAAGDSSGETRIVEISASGQIHVSEVTDGLGSGEEIFWMPDGRAVVGNEKLSIIKRDANGDWRADSANIVPLPASVGKTEVIGNAYVAGGVTPDGKIIFAGPIEYFPTGANPTDQIAELIKLDLSQTDDARPDVLPNGRDNASAFDREGNLHVVWYDSTADLLLYKVRDTSGRWSQPAKIDHGRRVGLQISMQINPDDLPSIAYFDGKRGQLKFATRDAQFHWTVEHPDPSPTVGESPSLQLTSDGSVWIAYYAQGVGTLRLAHRTATSAWTVDTIDASGNAGLHPSLARNVFKGRWGIAYTAMDGSIRVAEQQANHRWQIQRAASTTGGATALVLAFHTDPSFAPDWPSITYADAATSDLRYVQRAPSTGRWKIYNLATRGVVGRNLTGDTFIDFHDGTVPGGGEYDFWDASRNLIRSLELPSDGETAPQRRPGIDIYEAGKFLSVARGSVGSNFDAAAAFVFEDTRLGGLRVV